MGVTQVDQNQLEQIGHYVKDNIAHWMREQNIYPYPPQDRNVDKELLERMVRVEEGLKFQSEKLEQMMIQSDKRFTVMQKNMDRRFDEMLRYMDKRFEAVDTNFKAVDTRFEDMNKRFNLQTWIISSGFIFMGLLISVYQFLN